MVLVVAVLAIEQRCGNSLSFFVREIPVSEDSASVVAVAELFDKKTLKFREQRKQTSRA